MVAGAPPNGSTPPEGPSGSSGRGGPATGAASSDSRSSDGAARSPAGDMVARATHGLPLATWSLPFLGILALAILIFLAAFWLDVLLAAADQTEAPVTLRGLLHSVLFQDKEQARNTLGGLGEVMAAVLGLALTVSSIIVQLAATRFTPHITSLFFRARTNLLVLGFFVTTSVFVLWVNFSIGDAFLPRWGVLLSMLLMTVSLLLLFPYFAYVFDFLDPDKIVGRIMADGLTSATPTRGSGAALDVRQIRTVEAVDHLANIGLNAMQQKDKGIASGAIDALCGFAVTYGATKAALPRAWFHINPQTRQSPDFVSLSEEAIGDLHTRGTWVEWKILRQYQMLFGEALHQIKDACYLIAIDTRRLGEDAARRGDLRAVDLAIKFFNTYMRATINASDVRTAYNILHQYRQLAEYALEHPSAGGVDKRAGEDLQERARQIAKFMRYYGSICFQRKLSFVTEVIAHDVGQLCELAFRLQSPFHDELLEIFLAVDEDAETAEQETTLRGVRRAQIKLATTYLLHGADELAGRIQDDMRGEPATRLRGIWAELEALESREFWEVNDRGSNFDYLTPAQKSQLERFFSAFPELEKIERPKAVTLTP